MINNHNILRNTLNALLFRGKATFSADTQKSACNPESTQIREGNFWQQQDSHWHDNLSLSGQALFQTYQHAHKTTRGMSRVHSWATLSTLNEPTNNAKSSIISLEQRTSLKPWKCSYNADRLRVPHSVVNNGTYKFTPESKRIEICSAVHFTWSDNDSLKEANRKEKAKRLRQGRAAILAAHLSFMLSPYSFSVLPKRLLSRTGILLHALVKHKEQGKRSSRIFSPVKPSHLHKGFVRPRYSRHLRQRIW